MSLIRPAELNTQYSHYTFAELLHAIKSFPLLEELHKELAARAYEGDLDWITESQRI